MHTFGRSKSGIMTKQALRSNLIGVVAVSLSFALGITLYQAFLVADLDDLDTKAEERKPAPKPAPKFSGNSRAKSVAPKMKEFSGHGQAVSDNVPDNEKVSSNKQLIQKAKSSEMLT